MSTTGNTGPGWSQGLHPCLSQRWQHMGHLPLLFRGHNQGARLQMEQPGQKLVPIETTSIRSSVTHLSTMLAPNVFKSIKRQVGKDKFGKISPKKLLKPGNMFHASDKLPFGVLTFHFGFPVMVLPSPLPIQLPANLTPWRRRWWFKYMDPSYSHGLHRLCSRILASAWSTLTAAGFGEWSNRWEISVYLLFK